MNIISKFIYGSEPFELHFNVPLEKAISNLKLKVSKTPLSHLTSQGMIGNVHQDCTKLQRVIPMVQNSFKPIFVGSFHSEGDKTVLKGTLRFHRFVQVFMTFWFGFITLSLDSYCYSQHNNQSKQ